MISYCPKCGKPVADDSAFCPSCGAPLQAAQPVQPTPQPQPAPQYNNRFMNQPQENQGPKPDNHKALAIVVTVFSALMCAVLPLILGILGIVSANKVDTLWNSGRYNEANEEANKAKKMGVIGIVFVVIGIIANIIYLIAYFGGEF